MASNRDERRQARRRGAGQHQIVPVDFGISFPIPAAPRSGQRRRTPQLEDLPPSTKTPSGPGPGRNGARSSQKRGRDVSTPGTGPSASVKRHKSNGEPVSLSRATRSQQTTPHLASLPEDTQEDPSLDVDELEGDSELIDTIPEPQSGRTARTTVSRTIFNQEISESPKNAPGSGQRRIDRIAAVQASSSALRTKTTESDPSISSTLHLKTPRQPNATRKQPSPELSSSALFVTPGNAGTVVDEELDELSPEQDRLSGAQFSEVEEDETHGTAHRSAVRRKKNKRRKSNRNPADESLELDELDVNEGNLLEEPVEEREHPAPSKTQGAAPRGLPKSKPIRSPAIQRQPKAVRSKANKPKPKPRVVGGTETVKETVVIPVHRITKPIMIAEDESDADILNAEIPFAKRAGVNAVDVFAEFCEETISSGLETLVEGGSNAQDAPTRREYRTKMRAVEAFQEELRMRLLDLTIHLDAGHQLSKRVRSSQLEIKHLRDEVLRLRAQREQIAVREDEIRSKHEQSSKDALEQATLNTVVQDVELAIEQCKALPDGEGAMELQTPTLSSALSSVISQMSGKAAGGGILARVKGFNAFLERAALALEGKA